MTYPSSPSNPSNASNPSTPSGTATGVPSSTAPTRPVVAVILAAGRGTRMQSDLPKVAHPVAGRAMVAWVVDAVRSAGATRVLLVVGYGEPQVRAIFAGDDGVEFVRQSEQLGTGHATRCAAPLLAREIEHGADVLVLAGDGPLLRRETVSALLERQRATGAAATLATAEVPDATGYGRIVRDAAGRFHDIVEQKNLTPGQQAIREIYPSYAVFDARDLFASLASLPPDPVSGEYYLTAVPAMLRSQGKRVELVSGIAPEDVLSINTPGQLAEIDRILRGRLEGAAGGRSWAVPVCGGNHA